MQYVYNVEAIYIILTDEFIMSILVVPIFLENLKFFKKHFLENEAELHKL